MSTLFSLQGRGQAVDWERAASDLSQSGYALTGALLSSSECKSLVELFDEEEHFRSRIVMERYRFGKGDYKYFRYPLPETVESLRTATYPHLAKIANDWGSQLGANGKPFPLDHQEFLARCHKAGQKLPTPLVLHYEAGGFNCLHQDLYGEIAFPLQLVVMLGQHGRDWEGGEFVLVENVPRAQSRAEVITADQGHGIIFTTRYRPVKGSRGNYRVSIRHGVSRVRRGTRYTLGIIYHDAK
ncbi:MAG TPA: 2OG-Fe(II) oxygenase [Candidatus Eremiobacteraceae bacterium]|nr:2OG-Fe(II) oxygenase [Candidatus Eremiobacteraceae bacterium]